MTIEERLVEALSQIDDFQPSVDLFARVERSLDEDRAFRRRRLASLGAVTLSLTAVGVWLALSTSPGLAGHLFIDGWRVALAFLAIGGALIVALAPHIRRFARSFVDDVFHMSPATGDRFSRLLDIAYYLFFGGGILTSIDVTEVRSVLPAGESLMYGVQQVALFTTVLGLAHVGNLLLLPIVGLLFTSVTRRARRRAAGSDAPPMAERARKTDRLVIAIVLAAVLFAIAGGLLVIALAVLGV
jgi:hypothetical protein